MAKNWTEKDKKQVKILGIIVVALLAVLAVLLLFTSKPKEKQYTQEETAALSVKYVATQKYFDDDTRWPDLDDWTVRSVDDSYAASCTVQVKNAAGVYVDHKVEGLTVCDADAGTWHVSSLTVDGVELISN